jgi:hypothetical protein
LDLVEGEHGRQQEVSTISVLLDLLVGQAHVVTLAAPVSAGEADAHRGVL